MQRTRYASCMTGTLGTPTKSRRAAEARLQKESAWLERNLMVGRVEQLPDGRWQVITEDTLSR